MNTVPPDLLVSDLTVVTTHNHNGRSYTIWEAPKYQENIIWFLKEGEKINLEFEKAVRNDELLSQRLLSLVSLGANLKDKVYEIAEVNRPLFLTTALENGANPNIHNSDGELPIDRAFELGRNSIAKLIINHSDFNFKSSNNYCKNILFLFAQNNKFDLVKDIFQKHPEFSLETDKEHSTLYLLADKAKQYLGKDDKDSLKSLNLIFQIAEKIIDYADTQNFEFSINEKDNNGVTLLNLSPDMAKLIKEKYAIKLSQSLLLKNNNKNNKFKI